ncbi:MAG: ParA family protein [Elusimicrobia bacterium]|nr:ParA family protein [Elusimicrobiota bacterium]
MEIIVIANQKGGVGKTTTAINLAATLAYLSQETLLLDMDPQGNATSGLGFDKNSVRDTIYPVLIGEKGIESAIRQSSMHWLDIICANRDLTGAEVDLISIEDREFALKRSLEGLDSMYKYVIVDCPPSLGLLTLNGLAAAHKILVPMQCEYYALEGLSDLFNTVRRVKESLNPNLEVDGALMTMFDGRNSLAKQVRGELEKFFGEKLYQTVIPRSVRLAEAPSFGKPILVYDPSSKGGKGYLALGIEFLKRRRPDWQAPEAWQRLTKEMAFDLS